MVIIMIIVTVSHLCRFHGTYTIPYKVTLNTEIGVFMRITIVIFLL